MEAIRFQLGGSGASFRKPHTNRVNFTYSNIHKTALLGILGGIMGFKGHTDKTDNDEFPEFYIKLKGLKVSIVPSEIYSSKTISTLTDTTGLTNIGMTYVSREQSIVNPSWTIYIKQGSVDIDIYDELKNRLINSMAKFIPYLGKNHYPANISDVDIIELEKIDEDYEGEIKSLVLESEIEIADDFELDDVDNISYYIEEYYPTRYRGYVNYYIEEKFILTNKELLILSNDNFRLDGESVLYFV